MNKEKETTTLHAKEQRSFTTHIIFGTSFTLLTSGVFLNGLAMFMGASDLLASYISVIANICGISILFFSSLIGRAKSFKKIVVGLTFASRFATLILVLIPLLPAAAQIPVFIPVMVIAFTLQAQTTVVLNNWMVSFVDGNKSGRYIARRQTFVLIVNVIIALAGGQLMDAFGGKYLGFAVLFAAALAMSATEILILLRIPDALQPKRMEAKSKLIDTIRIPIKNKSFLRFVLYIFLFYLMLTIADSYTVIYMMRYLELSYLETTGMQLILSLPQIFLLGFWGRISDRKGHGFVLKTSIWFFVGQMLFFALSNRQNLYFLIPMAFLFAAVANSGFVVSVFNRRYELMPKEGRVMFDNFYTAAIGLAFILGPVIGGAIKGLLESSSWVTDTIPLGNIRLLFAISTIGLVLLQLAITLFRRRKKKEPCTDADCCGEDHCG